MNSTDWKSSSNTERQFRALQKIKYRVSGRKLRLFCVGCSRLIWQWLEEPMRQVIEVAERHADGAATANELPAAHAQEMRRNRSRFDKQGLLWGHGPEGPHGRIIASWAYQATEGTSRIPRPIAGKVSLAVEMCAQVAGEEQVGSQTAQADVLRDVIGNPFDPVRVEPAWLTLTVKQLAEAIYADRAFDRMPILGDALEDAGCTNADILNHCRQSGEHVRGCWVIDLLTGRE